VNKAEIEAWFVKHENYYYKTMRTDQLRELLVDYALVPRVLSVEMKVKLAGKFSVRFPEQCPECAGTGWGCMECGGSGTVITSITIPLVTIKQINKAIIEAAENDNPADVIVGDGGK